MSEPIYSIVCWAIRLSPVIFMGATWLLFYYRFPDSKKAWVVFGVGYLSGVLSVWAYWEVAVSFAPNDKIAEELLSKDGAPRVFALFVMPFLVAVYFLLMLPITWLITKVLKSQGLE